MIKLTTKVYLNSILIISLVAISFAYFVEYALGHQPCNLCLIERIPYGLSIILIVLTYIFKKKQKFIILLLIQIFVFSLIISFYHFGIEQGIFQESLVCGIESKSELITKEELLKQLQEKTVSCKDVTFRVFGLSLTAINIILSLFLTILLIRIFVFYEKDKR